MVSDNDALQRTDNVALKDMEESKKSIEDIKKSVDEINAIPNKRWEGVINTALGCIVSVIIGAILALVIK